MALLAELSYITSLFFLCTFWEYLEFTDFNLWTVLCQ